MKRLWLSKIFWTIAGAVLFTGSALGDGSLSDTQKKETVYAMYADYKKDFPAVTDISPQQAMALLKNDDIVFVDTRKPAEMTVSMLPHALSRNEFLDHPEKYGGKTVVGYCTISYRSGLFAREMAQKGITVRNLKGGILAWTLEGGTVYDQNGATTKRLHVYGKKWDFAPAGYETVMFGLWEQLF
ncbi:MAG: rhodanese-like domain-containing protein [Desulfobacterales bacterium]